MEVIQELNRQLLHGEGGGGGGGGAGISLSDREFSASSALLALLRRLAQTLDGTAARSEEIGAELSKLLPRLLAHSSEAVRTVALELLAEHGETGAMQVDDEHLEPRVKQGVKIKPELAGMPTPANAAAVHVGHDDARTAFGQDNDGNNFALRRYARLAARFTRDPSELVRTAALNAIHRLQVRGSSDILCYENIVRCTSDPSELVRSAAARCLHIMGARHPEAQVFQEETSPEQTGVRMADDAFVKLARMLSDSRWEIRREACSLMGVLHNVSKRPVMLTLGKETMTSITRGSAPLPVFTAARHPRSRQQEQQLQQLRRQPAEAGAGAESKRVIADDGGALRDAKRMRVDARSPATDDESAIPGSRQELADVLAAIRREHGLGPVLSETDAGSEDGASSGSSSVLWHLLGSAEARKAATLALEPTPREEKSGVLGAVSIALEDEMYEVRVAGLGCVAELCAVHNEFTTLALTYVVDMLNDDIEDVRLQSVVVLARLCRIIRLDEDQLRILVRLLEEFNVQLRVSIHRFFSTCTVNNTVSVQIVFAALLTNLVKFPEDMDSVMRALAGLGASNRMLVIELSQDLLRIQTEYLTQEPAALQLDYMAAFVLVLAAFSVHCADIPTWKPAYVVPAHTLQHYHMYRDMHPEWYMRAECFESALPAAAAKTATNGGMHGIRADDNDDDNGDSEQQQLQHDAGVVQLLQRITGQVARAFAAHGKPALMRAGLGFCERDLACTETFGADFDGTSAFLRDAVVAARLALELYAELQKWRGEPLAGDLSAPEALICAVQAMEVGYLGLSREQQDWISQLRAIAMLWYLAVVASGGGESMHVSISDVFESTRVVMYGAAGDARALLETFTAPDLPAVVAMLQRMVAMLAAFPAIATMRTLRRKSVELTVPPSDSEGAHNFPSHFGLAVPLRMVLRNISDISSISVLVTAPGEPTLEFPVPISAASEAPVLQSEGDSETRLETIVHLVQAQAWSDPAALDVRVVTAGPLKAQCPFLPGPIAQHSLCAPQQLFVHPIPLRAWTELQTRLNNT